MNETLGPFTLGEILDRTAQLYRRNFLLFAGVAALPAAVMIATVVIAAAFAAAIAGVAASSAIPPSALTALSIALLVLIALPVYIAAGVFSYAGLTQAAVSANHGEKLTIRAALKSVRPHFWRYLWYLVLQGMVVALVPGAIAGSAVIGLVYLASQSDAGASVGYGFLAFLAVAAAIAIIIWLALSCAMGLAVCVVEQKSAWESLKRSWKLSHGTRGRIFVLFLLVMALGMVLWMIGYIPLLIVTAVISAQGIAAQYATAALVITEILNVLINFTLQTLLAPVSWIALVLFYYDRRIRAEGYDIEWMMEQAGLVPLQDKSGLAPPLGEPARAQPASPPPAENGIVSTPAPPPDTVGER